MSGGKTGAPETGDASLAQLDMGILGDDVGFQIHITRRAIWSAFRSHRRKDAAREPSGFYASLILIGANPGISQSELAEALVIDLPNIALILGRMSVAGLVDRQQDPADRRRFRLSLSPAGDALLQDALRFNESQRRLLAGALSAGETRQLNALLQKLQRSLKKAGSVHEGWDAAPDSGIVAG